MKWVLRWMPLAMLAALVFAGTPAIARNGSHGHHHGGHHRMQFSRMPATVPGAHFCASANRRVNDPRECPEPTVQMPNETPLTATYRENR